MTLTAQLDRFQQRHPSAGFPLAVLYKYVDDFGGYLAALITYYAFVSLFPLLLLLATVLGFVLAGDPHLQQEILGSALHQFPVVGGQLGDPKRLGGGVVGGLQLRVPADGYHLRDVLHPEGVPRAPTRDRRRPATWLRRRNMQ